MEAHDSPYLSQTTREWLSDSASRRTVETYLQYLLDRGYANSTIHHYLASIAHCLHWCTTQGIDATHLNTAITRRFLHEHLPQCVCAVRCQRRDQTSMRAALRLWVARLEDMGQIAKPVGTECPRVGQILGDFHHYLTDVCGVSRLTCAARLRHIRAFLRAWASAGTPVCDMLTPIDVERFITRYTARWSPSSRKTVYQSLRSYFRFEGLRGQQTQALIAAMPKIASWRLAALPTTLSAADITSLLSAFDRTTPVGRRDYAIARCLIDLGLRSSEIPDLTLDDVDWHAGTLSVHGKGDRIDVLPLPVETGRAIVAYLRGGRPGSAGRAIFVRHRAPRAAPITARVVRHAICSAAARGGLADHVTGPHILRHTAAQRFLQGGATLKEIADLLRHRSLETTMIYTKVDLDALTRVALPWPGTPE